MERKYIVKTIVLDDDPTGTQSAAGVIVLLDFDAASITRALRDADSVYVLTNTRAIGEADAVDLLAGIHRDAVDAARELGEEEIQFVLRGDSTLRGHVFAETAVFATDSSVILFVPAFPDGGRTTVDGVHLVRHAGQSVPAHLTEFADDPVFPFSTSVLVDYVQEKSGRAARSVSLAEVRSGGVAAALISAAPGSVVVPDAETNEDIALLRDAVFAARAEGADIVVRTASPLAAELAGVVSTGLLESPLLDDPAATILVCGSHTAGATAQLARIESVGGPAVVIGTTGALADAHTAGTEAGGEASARLDSMGFVKVTTERTRSLDHDSLDHGRRVMEALTTAVSVVRSRVAVVVSKGGITSAEVARVGLGVSRATVLGQVIPGVSVWALTLDDGHDVLYVVVPGNVGEADALERVLAAVGR